MRGMIVWKASKVVAEIVLVWTMIGGALRHLADVVLIVAMLAGL